MPTTTGRPRHGRSASGRGMKASAIRPPPPASAHRRGRAAHSRGVPVHPLGDRSAPLLLHRDQRRHRPVLVEQIGHDVAHQRRGGAGAEPAMLDERGDGIARCPDRREGDEVRMVAHPPGEAVVRLHAAGALSRRDAADLGGAGLAGDQHAVDRQPGAAGGAVDVHHRHHRVADEGEMLGRDRQRIVDVDRIALQQARRSARPLAIRAAWIACCIGLTMR